MAQTERSNADVLALLANNIGGDISPTDLRDALASSMGYASMVLSASGAPVDMDGVDTDFSLVDVFDTINSKSIDVNLLGSDAELAATYTLILNTAGFYRIDFFASFSASANNRLITFRPYTNGSPAIIEASRFIGTVGDTGSIGFSTITEFAAGDVCDLRVKVNTGTVDLTFLAAGRSAHRVG